MGKLIGKKTENYLRNAMAEARNVGGGSPSFRNNIGYSFTFVITTDWQQHENNGAYYCKAKHFYFNPEFKRYEYNETLEYTLYSPADRNTKPTTGLGEIVRAIYNGNWEIISGTIINNYPSEFAVVMSAIQCPDDPTATPNDTDFRNKMGEIRIAGKEYPPNIYDKCACLELAGKEDEYPEQILKGRYIQVRKAGSYNNPDYNQEAADEAAENGEPYDVPEKLDWYLAMNTGQTYNAKLDTDVDAGDVTTITVKDSDSNEIQFSVHADMAEENTYWKGNSSSFDIERRQGAGFIQLQIVNGVCSMIEDDEITDT
ncbi:MAG: hypothetical protein LBG58_13375 [Planctomycetaceae bacterium]|jgi:hypothetical protein|nr:hypothetical protein [Planctomycetaceae bacterium]